MKLLAHLPALDTKVLRDLVRMRAQLLAIALVLASGVGIYLGLGATLRSLEDARATYYAQYRFGDVFAGLVRAPERLARRLRSIEGVESVQTRVVTDVTLDVPEMLEAARGRLISLPERGRAHVNALELRSGRAPEPGSASEVVASEAFVQAHGFELGQRITAVIDGSRVDLTIVGTGLSPEYTYTIPPGLLFPDDRRFGVFWMRRDALGAAFDMDGAFNDVSLSLARHGQVDHVIARVDDLLADYGGLGAIPRADQQSAFFLQSDLTQLRAFTYFVPALFLSVAAFLLNIVFGRLIAGQRGDIAALKAFGYRDREVAFHYAKLITAVVLFGWILGVALGAWLGKSMTGIYGDYYRLPELTFRLGLRTPLEGLAITAAAAGLGAWTSIGRTISLPPAEAMRPEAPAVYRSTLLERIGLAAMLPTSIRIVLREVERKPMRALLSVTGVAMAAALTIVMAFSADSARYLLNVQFGIGQREDVSLTLIQPRASGVLTELEHLPGVLHAEPYRGVPVELRHGRRSKKTAITGVPHDTRLVGLLDRDLADVSLPRDGLVLSRKLAEVLDVQTGEELEIEVLEGERRARSVRVARITETFIGAAAYMNLSALCSLLGEPLTLNGANLIVDDRELPRLHAAVKETPTIAGISSRDTMLATVRRLLDQNIGTVVVISSVFALVMAFGVLYNTARITLAERARELATLRVLGFRRSEVSAILIGEMALVVLIGTPIGLLLGYALAAAMVNSPGFDTEQFRLPLIISSATYATAVLAVLAASLVSGWSAWRRLDRFDIVQVLKTRD